MSIIFCQSLSPTAHQPNSGLAHSTSEKQKPGPLDLALLFRAVIDVKRTAGVGSSVREILFTSIAEYNRRCTSKVGDCREHVFWRYPCWTPRTWKIKYKNLCMHLQGWRISESVRRLLYGILRCPPSFLEILKKATELCEWKHSGLFIKIMLLIKCSFISMLGLSAQVKLMLHDNFLKFNQSWSPEQMLFVMESTLTLQHLQWRIWKATGSFLEVWCLEEARSQIPSGSLSRQGFSTNNLQRSLTIPHWVASADCDAGNYSREGEPVGRACVEGPSPQSPCWCPSQAKGGGSFKFNHWFICHWFIGSENLFIRIISAIDHRMNEIMGLRWL